MVDVSVCRVVEETELLAKVLPELLPDKLNGSYT